MRALSLGCSLSHTRLRARLRTRLRTQTIIPTSHFQDSLPRLPLPTLEDTLRRYKLSARPLLDDADYKATEAAVDDFAHSQGPDLHAQLSTLRDTTHRDSSYISEPWFDMYLENRSPVAVHINPALTWIDDPGAGKSDQAVRAASLISSSLAFFRTMRDGHLRPDIVHFKPHISETGTWENAMKWVPRQVSFYAAAACGAICLDMSQYTNLFHSTRIPRRGKDEIRRYPDSRHIVVQRGASFYALDVIRDDGTAASRAEIEGNIRAILAAPIVDDAPAVGVLTAMDRDAWADARESLATGSERNRASLAEVDSALFAVCLEDAAPGDDTSETRSMLHGNGRNRWFDKSFQLIVNKAGRAAVNFEHSWGDGIAVLRYFTDVYNDSVTHEGAAASEARSSSMARPLRWDVSDTLAATINQAGEDLNALAESVTMTMMRTDAVDGAFLKQHKLGKDGFLQMSIQLAHYRMYGHSAATYESAATAFFKHGRTECIRSATLESDAFCRTFASQSSSRQERERVLRAAIAKHKIITGEAQKGQGWDRHLFAIKRLCNGDDALPDIFTDKAYAKLNDIVLSTSTLPSSLVDNGGFGPTGPDCYGIGYGMRDNTAGFCVSSFGRDEHVFLTHLEKALVDMRDTCASKA